MPAHDNTIRTKSIFITGAAAGIGAATARLFADRGWYVGLSDRDATGLAAITRAIGGNRCWSGALDVTDYPRFQIVAAEFAAAAGGVDLLFNNAGILKVERFDKIGQAASAQLVDVNLKGVINGIYAFLDHLKRRAGARIVSMCSASAIYGTPDFAVYSATKFAVRGLTEALNIEFAEYGIHVSDIMPSFVGTPMVNDLPMKPASIARLGVKKTAEDIAACVWAAAHGSKVHYIPAADNRLMLSLSGFGRITKPVMRAMMKR